LFSGRISRISFILAGWWFFNNLPTTAQTVNFTSSNLPIIEINTNGQTIQNDVKITADMGIIYNGEGQRNDINDPYNNYSGKIGIEIRGSSSTQFPKKQYALETRDALGNNLNASLLGMPAENDWILYAVYNDKSLMRDVLAFKISNDLGMYSSRSRFCELVLNDEYRGVYILLEKIKKDNDRVDIATLDLDDISGDSLTGGYIVKIDKTDGEVIGGWFSNYAPYPGTTAKIYYQYHYPKPDEIKAEQKTYIQNWINVFESVLYGTNWADPVNGYRKYIDVESFVDYFLQVELSKNVDGYRLSAFMYKDRDDNDGLLHMGPIWDYTLAYGNANYYGAQYTYNWWMDDFITDGSQDGFKIPFWWRKLRTDPYFANLVKCRWLELRQTFFNLEYIHDYIDSVAAVLDEAQQRNFQQWPILGEYIWPNPVWPATYAEEITYLRSWIQNRMNWMENNMIGTCTTAVDPQDIFLPEQMQLYQNYPNPFNSSTRIRFHLPATGNALINIYDLQGQLIRQYDLSSRPGQTGELIWDGLDDRGLSVSSAIYIYVLNADAGRQLKKMVLIR